LIVLNKTKSIGLQKLLLEAKLVEENGAKKRDFDTYTIGFKIAPRINAAGRMNHANVAYNLLMTTDPTEASDLAFELNGNNQDRQKTTEVLVKKAIEQVELNQKDSPMLFILGAEWPTGIIGLIAGKIKEKYYKPTIVMALNEGEITGSGRSIENFSIIEALQSVPAYFSKFGGHPMACGFTLKDETSLEPFKQAMIVRFTKQFGDAPPQPTVSIDAEVDLEHVNWELYDILSKFEPFGQNNEKPKYLARGLTITSINPVGKDKRHLTIMVSHHSAKIKKTIGWNLCSENGETNWCKILKKNDKIDLIFEIDVNEWNGNKELQLTIIDLKKSGDTDTRINADDADNADTTNEENKDNDVDKNNNEKTENNGKLIYEDLTYKINGILFSVHNKLGSYCNEKQICDAIEEELKINSINYEREKILPPSFAGEKSGRNRIDFLIEDKIIIEAKTIRFVGKEEYYQCMRYLEALNKKLCLLINFRDKQLRIKRILNPDAKI